MTVKQRVARHLVRQFHRPHGMGGRLAGWVMAHRSSNRRRNLWVVSLLDVQPTDRVLEIGFGPGIAIHALSELATRGLVYGVDHSEVMVRQAAKRNAAAIRAGRVDLRCGSVENLPALKAPLDKIMAVNSMGSWPEKLTRLTELRDRLRPGGQIAIASQPRCPGATKATSEQAAREIDTMLTEAGFSHTRVETLPLDPPVVCVLGVKHEGSKDQDCTPGLGRLGRTKQTTESSHTNSTEGTRPAVLPETAKPVAGDRKPPGATAAGLPSSRWLTLAVLCSTVLIINLDITVLNVALPTLVRDLKASSSQLQWIIDAYALVYGGLLLVSGSLADRVGRKRLLLAGMLAFAAGSAWAAFSGSVGTLVAARAGMGIGAALMMPPSLSIITAVFHDTAERQRAIGFWAGSSGVGFAVGPIISGLLLAHFWWGSVFLINVPIAVVGILGAFPLVPDSKNPAAPAPDLVGGFLSVCGLGLVLWSIIEAPVHGWSSALVIGTAVAGLTILAGFLAWEHHSSHPMLNLAFFRRRSFSGAVSALGLLMFALIGALFVLTQFLQFNLGYTPLQAGMRMLPIAAALAVVAPLSSILVRLAGTKLVTAAGLALVAAGLWQISGSSVTWTYADLLPGLVLAGIGGALVMPTVSGSVMGSVPRGDTAVAAATNGTFLQVGGALGVAVIGSVLSTRYQDRMSAVLNHAAVPETLRHTILGSIGGALALTAQVGGQVGRLIEGVARSAFVSGADVGFLVAAAVAVAGCALALIGLPARLPGGTAVPVGRQVQPGRGTLAAQPGSEDSPAPAE